MNLLVLEPKLISCKPNAIKDIDYGGINHILTLRVPRAIANVPNIFL
jgi:hypothetical protein